MASTGWRQRVLEYLLDARAPVTVDDLRRLLGVEQFQIDQLLLGLEEEWVAQRRRRFLTPAASPLVELTEPGRLAARRAYRGEPPPAATVAEASPSRSFAPAPPLTLTPPLNVGSAPAPTPAAPGPNGAVAPCLPTTIPDDA